jgi:hypothetical protein
MKSNIKFWAFVLFLNFALSVLLLAQGSGGPSPDPSTSADTNVPIDGGVSLLAAAGIAYGAKKLYKHKKNNN